MSGMEEIIKLLDIIPHYVTQMIEHSKLFPLQLIKFLNQRSIFHFYYLDSSEMN